MGLGRRDVLRLGGAGLAAVALSPLRAGLAGADPARNPYGHTNQVAALPPWDGSTSSASKPGSMRMFRGNLTHTYYGSGRISASPTLAWKFRMADYATTKDGAPFTWRGTGWTGQALYHAGYVFVGSTGGHFHCFDAATGALVWVYAAERMFKGSPALYQNRIYAPNVDNHLRCLDAATGALVWDWQGPTDIDSSPCVFRDQLYVGGEDGRVKCFDPATGELLWAEDFGVGSGEKPGSGGIESSLAIAGGTAYFGHLDGFVRAYSLTARRVLWQTDLGTDIDASALVLGNRLYIGVEEGDPSFHCLDRRTGASMWTRHIPTGVWSTAARARRTVIVGGNDGTLSCLDARSGAEVWTYTAPAPIWSSPSVVDDKVLFGAYDDVYRMLDATTGAVLWEFDIEDRSHSACAIEDGRIFVGGASGWFYCFSA